MDARDALQGSHTLLALGRYNHYVKTSKNIALTLCCLADDAEHLFIMLAVTTSRAFNHYK
jgi:hypothetical protein